MKYILWMEDEPCCLENGKKYYTCKDAPYLSLSEDILGRLSELEPSLQAAHKWGLCEMWDALKYLWKNGTIDVDWTAEEVMKEYKELAKKRPELYEEWTYADGTKCVVMDKDNNTLSVFTENGCIETRFTDDLKAFTGRTFKDVIVSGLLSELQKDTTNKTSEEFEEQDHEYN